MPTHVGEGCLAAVFERWVVFWNWEAIHICSESHSRQMFPIRLTLFCAPLNIHNQAGTCAYFYRPFLYSKRNQRFLNERLRFCFLKAPFWVLVYLSPDLDNLIEIDSHFFKNLFMFKIERLKIRFALSEFSYIFCFLAFLGEFLEICGLSTLH